MYGDVEYIKRDVSKILICIAIVLATSDTDGLIPVSFGIINSTEYDAW